MSGFFGALQSSSAVLKLFIGLVLPAALAIGLAIALAFVKRVGLLTLILYVATFLVTFLVFQILPDFVRAGGPLVGVLIFIFILLVTYIIERFLTLRRSRGKVAAAEFTGTYMRLVEEKNFDGAIAACDAQGGIQANVLKNGLVQVVKGSGKNATLLRPAVEARRVFEEAAGRETPLLERNLIMLTTIASIATMVGLLGTTIGMIRAFQAMAHAGAPDAIQLARGISEALFNTAGGLANAILGIIANNFFTNSVDRANYEINEAIYDTLEVLQRMERS